MGSAIWNGARSALTVGVAGTGSARVGRNTTELGVGQGRYPRKIGTADQGIRVGRQSEGALTVHSHGQAAAVGVNTVSQRTIGYNNNSLSVGQTSGTVRRAFVEP